MSLPASTLWLAQFTLLLSSTLRILTPPPPPPHFRYIPDISRSLIIVLEKMQQRDDAEGHAPRGTGTAAATAAAANNLKRSRLLQQLDDGSLSEESVEAALHAAVSRLEAETALQALAEDAALGGGKRVKLFLAVNPLTLPDPAALTPAPAVAAAAAAAAGVGSQTMVIDLVGDDDADAMLGRLTGLYAAEYKDVVSTKPGARIWL